MLRAVIASVFCTVCATPAIARWPDGVVNYCGFDGHWNEAGWRDHGWAQGGTEGIAFDREVKHHGRASLRIDGAPDQRRSALQLGGNPIQQGKQYVIRAWVKTRDITKEAALALLVHTADKPLSFLRLPEGSRLKGTHDWTLLEVKVPPVPAEAVRMFAYVWVEGPGTAWFDEFALTEEGVQVPPGGQKPLTDADYAGVRFDDAELPDNLLSNPGFENGLDGWYLENGKPGIDEQVFVGGKRSVRYRGFAECSYSLVQSVKIDPRRAYRLSLMLKTELKAGLSCMRLLAFKADGQGFGWWHGQDHATEFCYGRGARDWRQQSVTIRSFRPETEHVNVYLLLEDALGDVWFDDVKFAPLSLNETREVRGE